MTWSDYIDQQDYVGKRCEQYIQLVARMTVQPAGMSRGANNDYSIHRAMVFGYRLALADIENSIKSNVSGNVK